MPVGEGGEMLPGGQPRPLQRPYLCLPEFAETQPHLPAQLPGGDNAALALQTGRAPPARPRPCPCLPPVYNHRSGQHPGIPLPGFSPDCRKPCSGSSRCSSPSITQFSGSPMGKTLAGDFLCRVLPERCGYTPGANMGRVLAGPGVSRSGAPGHTRHCSPPNTH